VVVVGTDPRAWASGAAGVVAADLAPGRPLHPETWAELLRRSRPPSTVTVEVVVGPRPAGHGAVVGTKASAAVARLADEVFPPRSYAVIARLH
ncbi:MAG: hypothetical protein ACRDZW_11640, partial [Acidimicrobiales bacterium]